MDRKSTLIKLFSIIVICFLVVSFCSCSNNIDLSSIEEAPASDFEYTVTNNEYIAIDEYIGNETNVRIPDKIEDLPVRIIHTEAFAYNEDLECVIIPDSITEIWHGAFLECSNLKIIDFGSGVTTIASVAFKGCSSLEELKLPENLKSIGNMAFQECSSVKSIHVPKTVTQWGPYCFSKNTSLTKVELEDGLESIGSCGVFYGAKKLETITIPASVQSLGAETFGNCPSLKSVTFLGDAPSLYGINVFGESNDIVTLYYKEGTQGWENTALNAYKLEAM